MTRFLVLLALLAVVLAGTGCGARQEPSAEAAPVAQRFVVALDDELNANHAAILLAKANGEFDKAGLDVSLETPDSPGSPVRELRAGRVDLALVAEPDLLLIRDKKVNLVGVSALVTQPLDSVLALRGSGVRRVEDLRGKRVGVPDTPYADATLKSILQTAKVSGVRRVDVGRDPVGALESGRVDATLGGFWNLAGVRLAAEKRDPTRLRVDALGIPTYDQLVFTARRTSLSRAKSSQIRRFIQALRRGVDAAVHSPVAAADALVAAKPGTDRGLAISQVKVTLQTWLPQNPKAPYGYLDPGAYDRYTAWMRRFGLITQPTTNADPTTIEFLPAQGLPDPERP